MLFNKKKYIISFKSNQNEEFGTKLVISLTDCSNILFSAFEPNNITQESGKSHR